MNLLVQLRTKTSIQCVRPGNFQADICGSVSPRPSHSQVSSLEPSLNIYASHPKISTLSSSLQKLPAISTTTTTV